jgi:hypothetical protein
MHKAIKKYGFRVYSGSRTLKLQRAESVNFGQLGSAYQLAFPVAFAF